MAQAGFAGQSSDLLFLFFRYADLDPRTAVFMVGEYRLLSKMVFQARSAIQGVRGLRCDSCGNRDDAGVNADGFGAKLSVGEGNRFIECIARENADDGFDLYSKSILGPIGAVMIDRCVACGNGGMGFKLGGEDQQAAHEVRDCLAYANAGGGFSANSNQALRLSGLISWKNGPGPARDNYRLGKPGGGNEQTPERTGLLPEGSSEKAEQEFLRKVARPDITVVPGRREDGSIDLHGAFERRKRSVMFLVPRVSGGGAEKMIATLASCLADDYDVTLVTLLKANGQETYFVSEKVRRICLADRPRLFGRRRQFLPGIRGAVVEKNDPGTGKKDRQKARKSGADRSGGGKGSGAGTKVR